MNDSGPTARRTLDRVTRALRVTPWRSKKPARAYTLLNDENVQDTSLLDGEDAENDADTEFGGREGRRDLEKRFIRKLDARMSILVLIYVLNYIDRSNVSVARIKGFEEDLHLRGQEFNTVLSILYVGYILMQVPSNMLLNHFGRPSVYLPVCMAIWGLLSLFTGMTTNFHGALVCRFLLGFVEAAFFPGALFLLSKWYKRRELGVRTALLSCGSLISNAFGSLLASAVLDGMQGSLGRAAWRWLFFIEGTITIMVAVLSMFILPDFPSTSHSWLSPLEIRLAEQRMEEDVGEPDFDDSLPLEQVEPQCQLEEHSHFLGLVLAISDWKVWWLAITGACLIMSMSFNAFFPTLSQTMGYGTTETLLLCAPPWVFATFVAFGNSRHSDRKGERFGHIVGPLLLGIVGFVIAMSTMNTAARYISLFLMAQSYAGWIALLTWISNTFARPPAKRAVALALINAASQLGNIAGSYLWPKTWGPSYKYSFAVSIAASLTTIVMCLGLRQYLVRLNQKLAESERAQSKPEGFRYLV